MLARTAKAMLYLPSLNYVNGTLDAVGEQLAHPSSVVGLSDGGAHVGTICDVSFPTSLLQWWGRDRPNGRLPVELLVHKQTRATAETVGLLDRGLLAPGYRGDVNVIDFDGLRLHTPEFRYDLPAGGRRVIQRADGYLHTFVAGTEIRADGESTGATPGRLVRGAQPGSGLRRRRSGSRPAVRPRCRTRTIMSVAGSGRSRRGRSARPARRAGCGCGSAATRSWPSGIIDREVARRRQRHTQVVAGVHHERRAVDLRRQVGHVDLGERLEEAHGVVRRRRAPLQLVELLPLLAGAVGQELRREHLAERRIVAAPADPGDLEVEGGLPALLLGRRPQQPAPAVGAAQDEPARPAPGWRAANATATAAPCDTPSSGNARGRRRRRPARGRRPSRRTRSSRRPSPTSRSPARRSAAACGGRRGPPASAATRTSRGRGRGGSASSPP